MKLVPYDKITEKEYNDYIRELDEAGEISVPSVLVRETCSFEETVEQWRDETMVENCPDGWMPSTLYFMVSDKGRIYGSTHFRHELNDFLKHFGGHIGYIVRPSERRKGYATMMLKMMLDVAREKGYDRVFITCNDDNIGSAKTIENNGVREFTTSTYEGMLFRQYWIEL